jgi:NADH-ubiquinone oxidoreductase chain 3
MFSVFLSWLVCLLFVLAGFLVGDQGRFLDLESEFECGFDSVSFVGMPFSYQFFVISVLFLVFDVEISVIIPIILEKDLLVNFNSFYFVLFFLVVRVFYEWKGRKVDWD